MQKSLNYTITIRIGIEGEVMGWKWKTGGWCIDPSPAQREGRGVGLVRVHGEGEVLCGVVRVESDAYRTCTLGSRYSTICDVT